MHAWAARLALGDADDGDEQNRPLRLVLKPTDESTEAILLRENPINSSEQALSVRPTAPVRRRLFSAASNDEYIYIAHET